MNVKILILATVGLMLTMPSVRVCAQNALQVENSKAKTLPIKGTSQSTDGEYNFKSFEVEAAASGAYYVEFWLLPAKYANNCYTTFKVYVNDVYAGSINPSSGNWQAARVNDNEKLDLAKGANVIKIATKAPEFPEVETIKVSMNNQDATFSSEAFEDYLNDAIAGTTYDVPEEEEITMYTSDASSYVPMAHYSNVPLTYTFYNAFSFTKGQEIFITSSSIAEHKIDVVFYGTSTITSVLNDSSATTQPRYPYMSTSSNGYVTIDKREQYMYKRATSEEMQGLNWVGPSQKSLNSTTQVATVQITIPKTGMYLVRLRTKESGLVSVADLNVNGAYYYEDVPISLSKVDCEIPADGNEYATMTCCDNFGTDDPFLFIHGNSSDRIVGFNDDGPSKKINQYNLSAWDSYISQRYLIRTSGISVSNYSSYKPVSKCSILARVLEGSESAAAQMMAQRKGTTGMSVISTKKENSVIIPNNVERGSLLTVDAAEKINRISVFNLSGNCIGSASGKGKSVVISTSHLNMSQPGIYVISVETEKGITSKKVIVR